MNRLVLTQGRAIASALVLLAVACSPLAPQRDPSRFFVLTSIAELDREPTNEAMDISLGVGPVTVAPYLDRATLVTRVGTNQVEFSQIDRWAEPFPAHFARIQATNLATLLGARVLLHPWYSSTHLDYSVEIHLFRFERNSDGSARLEARWTIRESNRGQLIDTHASSIVEMNAAETTEASVAALSEVAADLSREIAETIRRLHSRQP